MEEINDDQPLKWTIRSKVSGESISSRTYRRPNPTNGDDDETDAKVPKATTDAMDAAASLDRAIDSFVAKTTFPLARYPRESEDDASLTTTTAGLSDPEGPPEKDIISLVMPRDDDLRDKAIQMNPHQWLKLSTLFHVHPKTERQVSLLPEPAHVPPRPEDNFLQLRKAQNRRCAEEFVANGVKFLEKNNVRSAMELYKQATVCDPTYAEAWFRAGEGLYHQRRRTDAITQLDRALELDPQHERAKAMVCAIENATGKKSRHRPPEMTPRASPTTPQSPRRHGTDVRRPSRDGPRRSRSRSVPRSGTESTSRRKRSRSRSPRSPRRSDSREFRERSKYDNSSHRSRRHDRRHDSSSPSRYHQERSHGSPSRPDHDRDDTADRHASSKREPSPARDRSSPSRHRRNDDRHAPSSHRSHRRRHATSRSPSPLSSTRRADRHQGRQYHRRTPSRSPGRHRSSARRRHDDDRDTK